MTLRDLRKQSGINTAKVVQELAVTERALFNYESGLRRLNIEQLIPLSRLYDVSLDELVIAAIETLNIRQSIREDNQQKRHIACKI